MVGNEGMTGMPFILGMGVFGGRALIQGGGKALRMPLRPFVSNSSGSRQVRRLSPDA